MNPEPNLEPGTLEPQMPTLVSSTDRGDLIDRLLQDAKFAARVLIKDRGFTLTSLSDLLN